MKGDAKVLLYIIVVALDITAIYIQVRRESVEKCGDGMRVCFVAQFWRNNEATALQFTLHV